MTDIAQNFLSFTDVTDNPDEDNPNSVYSKSERKVIDKYKEAYLAATSSAERRAIAQLQMFPDLFNFWKSKGKIYDKKDTRTKSNVRSLSNPFFFLRINLRSRNFFSGYIIHGGNRKNQL